MMTEPTKHANPTGHGDYERRDIGVAGVVYFLLGLAALVLLTHFLMNGLYSFLDNKTRAKEAPVSPLATNVPEDTRHIPPQYKTDEQSRNYDKYLKQNFPAPQLEIDERTQLDKIRLSEDQTLSTYDYIDKNAGTVRIPIDRAMDLTIQRLQVRNQPADSTANSNARQKPKAGKEQRQ